MLRIYRGWSCSTLNQFVDSSTSLAVVVPAILWLQRQSNVLKKSKKMSDIKGTPWEKNPGFTQEEPEKIDPNNKPRNTNPPVFRLTEQIKRSKIRRVII